MVGVVIFVYWMIEIALETGRDPSVMKSSDQLVWLWVASYSIMCWLVWCRDDVYR